MLKTVTPIDNTIYVEREFASTKTINETLDKSKKALIEWKSTSLETRKKILISFVENFLKNTRILVFIYLALGIMRYSFLVFSNFQIKI